MQQAVPDIIKWIIEDAEKVIRDAYWVMPPQCVLDAINRYKADNDWMTHFLEECCEEGEGLREKSGELFAAYRVYCAWTNDFTRSIMEFYTVLEQRGFARLKRREGIYVLGLKLAEEHLYSGSVQVGEGHTINFPIGKKIML